MFLHKVSSEEQITNVDLSQLNLLHSLAKDRSREKQRTS